MRTRILNLLIFISFFSCGSPAIVSDEQTVFSEKGVNKSELQSQVQRFAGVLIDRTSQALFIIESDLKDDEIKRQLLERLLAYSSSAVEIASGPTPEVNLLDMVVFVTLINDRWEKFWAPKVFKGKSNRLSEEFDQSQKEIWAVLKNVSTPEQRTQFKQIIAQWMRENKDLVLVERVRLNEIAKIEGEASEERAEKIEGVFTTVKGAVSAADQGVLIANRALFLSQKLPSILRLQARLGTQQTLEESLAILNDEDFKLDKAENLSASLGNTASLAGKAALNIKSTLEAFREAFPKEKGASTIEKMDKALALTKEANRLASYLNGGGIQAQEALEETSNSLSSIIWNIALAGTLFSLFSAIFWWGGYLFVKKRAPQRRGQ